MKKTEPQDITKIKGVLQIDHAHGIIWFSANKNNCYVSIYKLPTPIPIPQHKNYLHLNITYGHGYGHGTNWGKAFEKRCAILRKATQ